MSGGPPEFKSFPTFSSFPDLDDDLPKDKSNATLKSSKHKSKHRKSGTSPSRDRSDRHSKRSKADKGPDDSKSHKRSKREKELSEADLFIKEALRDIVPRKEESAKASSSKLFVEDRRGDESNIRYGRLDSSSVPKFRRFGYGHVLGFPLEWKMTPGSKAEVVLRGQKAAVRYISSRSGIASVVPRRLLVPDHSAAAIPLYEEFIAIPSSSRRKQDARIEPAYRSILPATNDLPDSDASSSSSSSSEGESEDEEFTVPTTEKTKSSLVVPTTIPDWLELLTKSVASAPTPESRASIALAVLSKAFVNPPSNNHDPTLRLRYLLAGASLWPGSKVEEEWERALEVTSRVPFEDRRDLWMGWLAFKLKTSGLEELEESVARIRMDIPRNGLSADMFELLILWRCCVAIAEAGYTERAVAIFQAQIELTLFPPPYLVHAEPSQKLELLEDFWESECPRAGETGAKGWHGSSPASAPSPARSIGPAEASTSREKDPFTKWADRESLRTRSGYFPRRTTDADDDPYTTILFSDIRSFLFQSSGTPTSESSILLVLILLQFLGLHIPGLSSHLSNADTWSSTWADIRSPASLFPDAVQERGWDVVNGTVVPRENRQGSTWGPVKEWSNGVLLPLEGYGVLGEGRLWEAAGLKSLPEEKVTFIRNIFQQSSPILNSALFDQYWLAFEAAFSPKQASKVSRTILSLYRDSLPRWTAHARLERLRGRVPDARKVYEASLTDESILSSTNGVAKMFWDYAEMEWLAGNADAVRAVIVRSTKGQVGASTALLRAKKTLGDAVLDAVSSLQHSGEDAISKLVALTNLGALLDLLIGGDIPTAMARYSITPDFPMDSSVSNRLEESLAVASTLLLYHHTKTLRSPVPPIIFRTHTENIILKFPRNTILLGMWLESERGETIWGRVRTTLSNIILKPSLDGKDISKALWGVWQEMERDRVNWEVEKVRGLLKRTIQGERSRTSVTAWHVAVAFELHVGQTKRAKQLLYQAVSECPWVKDLYMLPFTSPLRNEFSRAEMNQWANTMVERGVRLREGLEEYLEQASAEVEGGDLGSGAESEGEAGAGAGDAELEALISERRRLLPF